MTVQKQKLWSYQLHKCQNITNLKEEKTIVKCNNITLERFPEWKLLGITLDEHFQLNKHISKLLNDCYSPLFILKKLKQYTPLPVQKQLT